jgi:rod shape-determining protein MreC
MGVVNSDGVVGIVCSVGERFSTVIPAINTDAAISCKVKNSNNMGFLKWDGRDYRYCQLKDMAKHIELNVGDTVLTSGVSSIFPSNIMVGTIKEINTTESDAYHQIVVTLSTNYNQLGYVNIVSNNTQIEQLAQEHEYMD